MSKTIKKYWRRETIAFAIFGAAAIALAVAFLTSTPTSAGPKPKISTPTLSCDSSTQSSIDIRVTAGATGLPAGFSIQWETLDDFNASGWPSNSDCPLDENGNPTCPGSFCKASFSGNANASRYNLGAGESVVVRIGDILLDNGASTTCPDPLRCGTTYVFRAFGHATSTLNRSDWSANQQCSTLSCGDVGGCTLTQGWWKTHGPTGCVQGNNTNTWPTNSLTLGTVSYTDLELCSILQKTPGGNGLITLAHQLIAAKLNLANGSTSCQAVADAIAQADALIGSKVVPPVGSDTLAPGAVGSLVTTLNNYNNGAGGTGCPAHCESETNPVTTP